MNASWRQVLRGTASIDHTQANGPYSPRSLDVSGSRRGDFGQLNTPRSQHFMQASPRLNIGLNNDVKLHALSILPDDRFMRNGIGTMRPQAFAAPINAQVSSVALSGYTRLDDAAALLSPGRKSIVSARAAQSLSTPMTTPRDWSSTPRFSASSRPSGFATNRKEDALCDDFLRGLPDPSRFEAERNTVGSPESTYNANVIATRSSGYARYSRMGDALESPRPPPEHLQHPSLLRLAAFEEVEVKCRGDPHAHKLRNPEA